MKKLILALMGVALFTLNACEIEDTTEETPYEELAGDKDEENDRDS